MTYNEEKKRYEFVFDVNGRKEAFYVSDDLLANATNGELMTLFAVRIQYIIEDCLSKRDMDVKARAEVHMALHGTDYSFKRIKEMCNE